MKLGAMVAIGALLALCCGLVGCGEKKTAGEPAVQLGPAPGESAPVETAPAPEATTPAPVPPPPAPGVATTPATPATVGTMQAEPPPRPKTYTVKKGDTLSDIARRFYGSAAKWKDIYNANKDKIPDPNKIKPGIVLTLP